MNISCSQEEQATLVACTEALGLGASPPQGALQYFKDGKHAGTPKMLFNETDNSLTLNVIQSTAPPYGMSNSLFLSGNFVNIHAKQRVDFRSSVTNGGADISSGEGLTLTNATIQNNQQKQTIKHGLIFPVLRSLYHIPQTSGGSNAPQTPVGDDSLRFFIDVDPTQTQPAGLKRSDRQTMAVLPSAASLQDVMTRVNDISSLLVSLGLAK